MANPADVQGLDLVTMFSIIGIILFVIIFPDSWAEKIENMFGKIFSRSRPDCLDVEKICKQIRKTPER